MPKKLRKTIKSILQVFSANMLVKAFAILSLAYFTRYLSKEELAILPAFLMLSSLSGVFFNFGLYPTMLKTVPSLVTTDLNKAKSIINTIGIVMIANACIFSLATYFLAGYISEWIFNSVKYQLVIKILSIGFLCKGVNNFQQYVMQAFSRFGQMSKLILFTDLIRIILTLILTIRFGYIGLAVGLVITQIIVTVFSFLQLKDILFSDQLFSPPIKLIQDSLPFYLEGFLMYFRRDGDNLLITLFLGPEILAIYYIAKRLADLMNSFFNTLDAVLTSNLSKLKDDIDQFKIKIEEIISIFNLLVLPGIFLVAAISPAFIFYLTGPKYTEAMIPSIILIYGPFFRYYFNIPFGRAIFIFRPPTSRFKLTLVATVSLLLSLIVLGFYWGLIGVALANIVCGIITGLYAYYDVNKNIFKINFKHKEFLGSTLMCSVMVLPIYYSQFTFGNNILIIIGSYLIGLILFLVIIHLTISNKFYSVVNTLSPINILDPIKVINSKLIG